MTILLFLLPGVLIFLGSHYMKVRKKNKFVDITEPTDLPTLKEFLTKINPKDFHFSKLAKENNRYVFYASITLPHDIHFSIHFYLDKEQQIEEANFFYKKADFKTNVVSIDLRETQEEKVFLQELWNSFDQLFQKRKEQFSHLNLKKYQFFSFDKKDGNFDFYCSNNSHNVAFRFVFNQNRELQDISIFFSIENQMDALLLIKTTDIPSELEYSEHIWNIFKPLFKQDKNTRMRMITEGFI